MKITNIISTTKKSSFIIPGDCLQLSNDMPTLAKPITFDEIRFKYAKSKKQMPDGHIHQIALDAGFHVES